MKAILVYGERKLDPVELTPIVRDGTGAITAGEYQRDAAGELVRSDQGRLRATYQIEGTGQRFVVVGTNRAEIAAAVKAELAKRAAPQAAPALPALLSRNSRAEPRPRACPAPDQNVGWSSGYRRT